jgi:heme exporter protein D
MSETMKEFLAMGGYAPYVWSSYGLALVLLLVLLVASLAGLRSRERTLAALEAANPRRRRRKADVAGGDGGEGAAMLPMTGGRSKGGQNDATDADAGGGE